MPEMFLYLIYYTESKNNQVKNGQKLTKVKNMGEIRVGVFYLVILLVQIFYLAKFCSFLPGYFLAQYIKLNKNNISGIHLWCIKNNV